MGKKRVIAETGAGQHGVATATACAYFGLDCVVYMGEVDTERQALNVARMRMLGAEVVPVTTGSRTLKDAINEALRDWVANVDSTHYLLGTAAGAAPVPGAWSATSPAGSATRPARSASSCSAGCPTPRSPASAAGPTRSGSSPRSSATSRVRLYGFEAGGDGFETGRHAATITAGQVGVLHGTRSYLLQDDDGQTIESHSISAGLDYPGVGPEHAWLPRPAGRRTAPITDAEAMDAMAPARQDRGHHPRHRERARAGRRARRWPASSARTRCWSSACPAAATRTWTRPPSWFGLRRARLASTRERSVEPGDPGGPRRRVGRRWSATCRRASRPSTASIELIERWSTPASTSSRSGCRTPTR